MKNLSISIFISNDEPYISTYYDSLMHILDHMLDQYRTLSSNINTFSVQNDWIHTNDTILRY